MDYFQLELFIDVTRPVINKRLSKIWRRHQDKNKPGNDAMKKMFNLELMIHVLD